MHQRFLKQMTSAVLLLLLVGCGSSAATVAPPTTSAPTSAGTAATPEIAPTQASTGLRYLWPATIPADMQVVRAQSMADETGFVLEVQHQIDPQQMFRVSGGPSVLPPPAMGRDEITIRGVSGYQFTTGAGMFYYWEEAGVAYSISGFHAELLAIAEALEPLTLAEWQQRLR